MEAIQPGRRVLLSGTVANIDNGLAVVHVDNPTSSGRHDRTQPVTVPVGQLVPLLDPADGPDEYPADTVLFGWAELLAMFGEFALPPWYSPAGDELGADIDCAPLAQQIADRLRKLALSPAPAH